MSNGIRNANTLWQAQLVAWDWTEGHEGITRTGLVTFLSLGLRDLPEAVTVKGRPGEQQGPVSGG